MTKNDNISDSKQPNNFMFHVFFIYQPFYCYLFGKVRLLEITSHADLKPHLFILVYAKAQDFIMFCIMHLSFLPLILSLFQLCIIVAADVTEVSSPFPIVGACVNDLKI